MITSMTGFARGEATGPWGSLTCELRSVNHRFLESQFRLPEELRGCESDLRQALAREVKRGKVDCTVHLRAAEGAARALDIDEAALARLVTRLNEVMRTLPEGHTVDALDVLRWPGVIREAQVDTEGLRAALNELFAATARDLVAARTREGERLRDLIGERCTALEALVAQVRARLPEVHTRVRSRLEERIAELQGQVDQDRVEQEIVMLLQRLDVAEELDRLTGHIDETRRIITSGEPAGRRLDFLMQEFNREANTLSSKSQDLDTTRLAVDMKVLIEQMREQVQNVE
jgi:uncharacterized protein (TIGR00255 family)